MSDDLKRAADAVLGKAIEGGVPGVVAIATDRGGNFYEGAAGVRMLGEAAPMTPDTVFAIFSTTKAITGTAALQFVEEGKLDLDAPASTYAPEIGELQVLDGFDADGNPKLRPPKRDDHHADAAAAHRRVRLRLLQRGRTTGWRRTTASRA